MMEVRGGLKQTELVGGEKRFDNRENLFSLLHSGVVYFTCLLF